MRISACVVCMNEEDVIGRCLDSLAFCDELIVVDSHSTDRTRDLAREHGATVIERDWPGFGAQKEFAVAQARNDWVLCLDADEWLSPQLSAEVQALVPADFESCAGWRMPRLSYYLGTWVTHGGWYPDRQLRLYDRRAGRWAGRPPHERVELSGVVRTLNGNLLHRPYRSLSDHLCKIDHYTTVMSEDLHARGRRAGVLDWTLRPALHFLKFYLAKRGFLLGRTGLWLSYLDAHYVRLKYVKLAQLQRRGPALPPEDRA